MSKRGALSLALVAAVATAGSISAAARSTTAPPDCPQVTGPAGYDTQLAPSAGAAGTTVTVSGALPAGDASGGVSGETVEALAYWNLAFGSDGAEWTSVFSSPVAAVAGSPVQQLATQDVAGPCSYRLDVTIPSVPPGTYPIEVLYRWAPGYPDGSGWGEASFAPTEFRVTDG
jgi:hypothetical protein